MTTPIVWLPGLLCNEALFSPINARLTDAVNTECAQLPPLDSMQALAKDVIANSPKSFILGGLSMGGVLALEVFRQAPERIKGLILLDTNAADEKQEVSDRRNALVSQSEAGHFNHITPQILLPLLVHPSQLDNKRLTQTICTMAEEVGLDAFKAHAKALATRPDARDLLSQIQVPTLIICGEQDKLCPVANHQLMKDNIAHSTLHILPNCGHLSTMEQPEAVANFINPWLTRVVTN